MAKAAEVLKSAAGASSGLLVSPSATVEEGYLTARVAEHLGSANLDHRIRRRDFSDQHEDPLYPYLGTDIAGIEEQDAVFLVGSSLRREVPILAHRVRKAALNGAAVSVAAAHPEEYFFEIANQLSGSGLVDMLSGVVVAAAGDAGLPAPVQALCEGVSANETQRAIAASLKDSGKALVLLGNVAGRHGAFSAVRALAAVLAELTGATFGSLSEGANSAGLSLVGVLPHRVAGGEARGKSGLHAAAQVETPLDALLLLNVEPDADLTAVPDATAKLAAHGFVVALSPFDSPALRESADLLLPVGTFAETSGTYVNVAGTAQGFEGIANPVGEARPAWKVLRVLGNLLEVDGFDYIASEDVRDAAAELLESAVPEAYRYSGSEKLSRPNGEDAPSAEIDIPLYSIDGLVRRAHALQLTAEARRAAGEAGE